MILPSAQAATQQRMLTEEKDILNLITIPSISSTISWPNFFPLIYSFCLKKEVDYIRFASHLK